MPGVTYIKKLRKSRDFLRGARLSSAHELGSKSKWNIYTGLLGACGVNITRSEICGKGTDCTGCGMSDSASQGPGRTKDSTSQFGSKLGPRTVYKSSFGGYKG